MAVGAISTQTKKEKTAAKAEAIKQAMGGITKAKQAEVQALGTTAGELGTAFEAQKGAAKLGIQSQLAQQLAQQEGMGAGYNKAAARQAAATAGTQAGMAVGGIDVQKAKEVGGLMAQQAGAKTEAAAQLYEQLTGEQKLEKETEEGLQLEKDNLQKDINTAIEETSGGGGDDEELAVNNLMALYDKQKDTFDAIPEMKKELARKIAGIYKDAIDEDWDDADPKVKNYLSMLGFTKAEWDATAGLDY